MNNYQILPDSTECYSRTLEPCHPQGASANILRKLRKLRILDWKSWAKFWSFQALLTLQAGYAFSGNPDAGLILDLLAHFPRKTVLVSHYLPSSSSSSIHLAKTSLSQGPSKSSNGWDSERSCWSFRTAGTGQLGGTHRQYLYCQKQVELNGQCKKNWKRWDWANLAFGKW